MTTLLQDYSIESLILFVFGLGVAFKFGIELWEWFYEKFRDYFNIQTEKQQDAENLNRTLQIMNKQIDELRSGVKSIDSKVETVSNETKITTERLQENARSYIIDKHHYYYYTVGAIDEISLQSLERRYGYYTAANGNTYIEGLMQDLRDLPRIRIDDPDIIHYLHEREEHVKEEQCQT